MRTLILTVFALCWTSTALAAPAADLWPRWQAHDAASSATIDHSAFDAFVQQYVVANQHGPNGVRYAAVDAAGRKKLADYLQAMQAVAIDQYNRAVQRAYWTNLYNAETLHIVLENYPVDSIRDIGGGLFSSGPWDQKVLTVDGEDLSLNDIEHRILRPIWHDSLTHYGVNCASIGCPSLRVHAYTGAKIDAELRANARDYVNSREGVVIDNGRLTVSKIYDWYGGDFGDSPQAIIRSIAGFASPALARQLKPFERIDGYAYDWSLNSQHNVAALASGR